MTKFGVLKTQAWGFADDDTVELCNDYIDAGTVVMIVERGKVLSQVSRSERYHKVLSADRLAWVAARDVVTVNPEVSLSGVVFTTTSIRGENLKFIKGLMQTYGAQYQLKIGTATNLVLAKHLNRHSSKLQIARERGIEVVALERLWEWVAGKKRPCRTEHTGPQTNTTE